MRITIKNQFMRPVTIGLVMLIGSVQAIAVEPTWKSGEHVYSKVCEHCHESGVGPVIKGRNLPLDYITTFVRNGFRAMPAFRSSFIDDNALQSVADYISKSPVPKAKE